MKPGDPLESHEEFTERANRWLEVARKDRRGEPLNHEELETLRQYPHPPASWPSHWPDREALR